jgi:hypothetical protein
MPDYSSLGLLRCTGSSPVTLSELSSFSFALDDAYTNVCLINLGLIGQYFRSDPPPVRFHRKSLDFDDKKFERFFLSARAEKLVSDERSEEIPFGLVLNAVVFQSDGYLELLGRLNPLNFLLQLFEMIHEQRKDRKFREEAESERLALQNLLLKTEAIEKVITVAERAGVPQHTIAAIIERTLLNPLISLDQAASPLGKVQLSIQVGTETGKATRKFQERSAERRYLSNRTGRSQEFERSE